MSIYNVRAILEFKTPHGDLRKGVYWSFYETKALLTASANPDEAFNKFLKYGKRIIGSCMDLMHLNSIAFYEEIRDENKFFYKRGKQTQTIQIVKNGGTIVEFKVMPN